MNSAVVTARTGSVQAQISKTPAQTQEVGEKSQLMLRNFGPLMAARRGRDSVLEGWDWVGPMDGPTLGHLGTQVGLYRSY